MEWRRLVWFFDWKFRLDAGRLMFLIGPSATYFSFDPVGCFFRGHNRFLCIVVASRSNRSFSCFDDFVVASRDRYSYGLDVLTIPGFSNGPCIDELAQVAMGDGARVCHRACYDELVRDRRTNRQVLQALQVVNSFRVQDEQDHSHV